MGYQKIWASFSLCAAAVACAPQGNQASVEAVSQSKVLMSVGDIKASKVLETGVKGNLLSLLTDEQLKKTCETAVHNEQFKTAIFMDPQSKDRGLLGELSRSGYFADPDAAIAKIDKLMFSSGTIPLSICINKVRYFSVLTPTVTIEKESRKTKGLVWTYQAKKTSADGYTSNLFIDIELEKYPAAVVIGNQIKEYNYYGLSSIGVRATPSGDKDEWKFGRSKEDIAAITKNVEAFYKKGNGPDEKSPNAVCSIFKPTPMTATVEEARDESDGVDSGKIGYDVSIKAGSQTVEDKKGFKTYAKKFVMPFTISKPGIHKFNVVRQFPQLVTPGRANMGQPAYAGETPVAFEVDFVANKDCAIVPPINELTFGDYTMYINFK